MFSYRENVNTFLLDTQNNELVSNQAKSVLESHFYFELNENFHRIKFDRKSVIALQIAFDSTRKTIKKNSLHFCACGALPKYPVAPDRKIDSDQTYSYPRDWGLSVSLGPNYEPILTPSIQ